MYILSMWDRVLSAWLMLLKIEGGCGGRGEIHFLSSLLRRKWNLIGAKQGTAQYPTNPNNGVKCGVDPVGRSVV